MVGNKVVAAARALNLPITVVRTAADQLVVVQRADLDLATDAKARRLGVADNGPIAALVSMRTLF